MTENGGTPSIDRSVLDRIRLLEGPGRQGLVEKVVALYLSDSLTLMEQIRSSPETGEAETLRRASHSLKSSSANVGAMGIFEICRKVEEGMAAGNPPSAAGPLLERLEKEYRDVRRELQAVLSAGHGEAKGGA